MTNLLEDNAVKEPRQQKVIDMDTDVLDLPERTLTAPTRDTMTPIELLSRAVERGGFDAEQLKILAELQERYQANRAREEFALAMNTCQQELPLVVKDAANNQTKSRYAKMENIQYVGKPIWTSHGFSLSFGESDCPTEGWKRTICDVRHRGGHTEQYHIDLPLDGVGAKGNAIGAMNPVQAAVSTGTYGQRQLTCRIFNITIADTDMDGRELHPNPEANPNAPKADPRGKRQEPAPIPAMNPNGVALSDVTEVSDKWKKDNPKGSKTEFGDWVQKLSGRNFRGEWSGWTASDLGKCQEALGLENTSGIPF